MKKSCSIKLYRGQSDQRLSRRGPHRRHHLGSARRSRRWNPRRRFPPVRRRAGPVPKESKLRLFFFR